jgi:glycine/D-amino acid oxidase-like deaminating enzyme
VIVIVGAGVCGLATAYELSRRGEQAIVLERGEPFAEQSAGLARIFRIAHRRPELCRLAMRARAGWQRWETDFGVGRLLGSEGYIAVGAHEDIAAAMHNAGAVFSWLERPEIAAKIPFLVAPWESGVFDPFGGSLRIRRALTALARRVVIRRSEVVSVGDDGTTTLTDGTVVRGDRVLICAGVQTPALFGPLGVEFVPHTRVTYEGADAVGAACLSAPDGRIRPPRTATADRSRARSEFQPCRGSFVVRGTEPVGRPSKRSLDGSEYPTRDTSAGCSAAPTAALRAAGALYLQPQSDLIGSADDRNRSDAVLVSALAVIMTGADDGAHV